MAEEDNIKKIIKEVPELILKDIDSFLLLRTDGNLLLHQYKLGGGNILALMGQFSVLNFLAKVYKILSSGLDGMNKISEETLEVLKECQKKNPELKVIKRPNKAEIIEIHSFIKLVKDYPLDLGIPKDDDESIRKVWNDIRNKVSHISSIAKDNVAVTYEFQDLNFSDALEAIKSATKPAFLREKGRTFCWVDMLNSNLRSIVTWICNKIDAREFSKENIESTISWLRNEDL